MNIEDIQKLTEHMEISKLRKIVYKKGDFEIHLEKDEPVCKRTVVETAAAVEEAPALKARVEEPTGVFVTSPMVGMYYAAPGPDQAHFVKVGDKIHEKTVVCIVEAMKVMNEVKAGVTGTVAEIILQNGHPVEYGTRLIRVVP